MVQVFIWLKICNVIIFSNSTSQTVFVHLKLIPTEGELDTTGSYNDKLTFTVEVVKPTTL